MKSTEVFTSNRTDSPDFAIVTLTEQEMYHLRGGGRPPVARPKDEFDTGDESVSLFASMRKAVGRWFR